MENSYLSKKPSHLSTADGVYLVSDWVQQQGGSLWVCLSHQTPTGFPLNGLDSYFQMCPQWIGEVFWFVLQKIKLKNISLCYNWSESFEEL